MGLAVTLAESCFSSHGHQAIGAELDLVGELTATALLFSESPSRIVISFDPAEEVSIREIAESKDAPMAVVGRVGGSRFGNQRARRKRCGRECGPN